MSIAGINVLVTGAAQGIGLAIAERLAKDGANVALVDMKQDKLEPAAEAVRAHGNKVCTFVADISDREQVSAAVEHTYNQLGGLSVMINNAGIAQVDPIDRITPEAVSRMMDVNVKGVIWGMQAAARYFRANKQPGKIINACSIAGHEGYAMLGSYCASKFAVHALTQVAAKEYAADNITVNSYCPGVVGTDMWTEIDARFAELTDAKVGETFDQFVAGIALGRAQTPQDVANFVAFLSGPDSDYVTGQSLITDGGLVFR